MHRLNSRGFSLIELLLAVIILSVATGITIRVLNNLNIRQEFRSLADEVLSDMKTARSLAFNAIQDDPCGGPITHVRVAGTATGYAISRISPTACAASRTILTKDLTVDHPFVTVAWERVVPIGAINTFTFALPTGRLYQADGTSLINFDIRIRLSHSQLGETIDIMIQPNGNMFLQM